jgi:hypothetical protein
MSLASATPGEIQSSPLCGCVELISLRREGPHTCTDSVVEQPISSEICGTLAKKTLW